MASVKDPDRLNPELEELAINLSLECVHLSDIYAKLGFKNRLAFFYYRQKFKDFETRLQEARLQSCEFIEDSVLKISEKYGFKEAKTQLEAFTRVLAWRIPSRYSQRIDMNVNQTVSIQHNIAHANDRLSGILRTVTPVLIADKISNPK